MKEKWKRKKRKKKETEVVEKKKKRKKDIFPWTVKNKNNVRRHAMH